MKLYLEKSFFPERFLALLFLGADFKESPHSSSFCLRFQFVEELSTKTKNQNEVGEKKKQPAKSHSYLCESFLVLRTGVVDRDEGRIGPSESCLVILHS